MSQSPSASVSLDQPQLFLNKNTFSDKFRFLIAILIKHGWMVLAVLGLEVIISLLSALIPYFTKLQVDQLQLQATDLNGFGTFDPLMIFGFLIVAPLAIELVRMVVFEKLSAESNDVFRTELRLDIEQLIWGKLETLDVGFFQNERNSRILGSALNATGLANDFFNFLKQRLGDITMLATILPLLGLVSWPLLVMVITVTILQMFLNEVARKQDLAISMAEDIRLERFWKIDSSLSHDYHILKMLGAVNDFLSQYKILSRERTLIQIQRDAARRTIQTYQWFLRNGLTVGANLLVGWMVLQGQLSLGTFTLVVSYTFQLNGIFATFLSSIQEWLEIDLQFDRLFFFSLMKPRIRKSAQPLTRIGGQKISFNQVTFQYPDLYEEEREYLKMMMAKTERQMASYSRFYYQREIEDWKKLLEPSAVTENVLSGVNLQVHKGKIVALLGRNGAGKTTITHLLMHHYEPVSGEIMLDDKPLYEYDRDELIQQFGVIQQQPFILSRFSVKENLMLGVSATVTEKQVWEVLEALDLKSVIQKLPQKLDTILGEGVTLSGGQEQLIAVARVLLQRRPFLVFDEGMNQMDIEHETKVMDLLRAEKEHSGIIFITHRITTARKADYIYMLDQGKIAEEGTHTELMKLDGLYAKFWNMQVIE